MTRPGTIDATPWAKAAVGDAVAYRQLRARVPAGHCLHLSARSARGPWHVGLTYEGRTVWDRRDQPDLRKAVDAALAEAELWVP